MSGAVKWVRECPMCGNEITYARKGDYDKANRARSACASCANRARRRARISSRGYVTWGQSYVHRIVCEAWYGPPPTPEHQVNHKDGDKTNAHPDNLEWVTYEENRRHAARTGLLRTSLTEAQVREIRRLREGGESLGNIAARYNVDTGKISRIARGAYYGWVA